jgi:hypothetical protein
MLCHGAGLNHPTLSDLVVGMDIVTSDGELKTFQGESLIALAGSMGLGGVVLALRLKLEAMSYANMNPRKELNAVAVPPVDDGDFACAYAGARLHSHDADVALFKRRIAQYYSEFFWFPFHSKSWVNCWDNDGDRANAIEYPSPAVQKKQAAAEFMLHLGHCSILKALSDVTRAKLIARSAMADLDVGPIVTPVINALHFRRGIHNCRVRDMEGMHVSLFICSLVVISYFQLKFQSKRCLTARLMTNRVVAHGGLQSG